MTIPSFAFTEADATARAASSRVTTKTSGSTLLACWLSQNRITPDTLAVALGINHETVLGWLSRGPRWTYMPPTMPDAICIEAVTLGVVRVLSWCEPSKMTDLVVKARTDLGLDGDQFVQFAARGFQ